MVKIEPPQPLAAGSSDQSVSHTVDQLHVTRHSALRLHILKQCVLKTLG